MIAFDASRNRRFGPKWMQRFSCRGELHKWAALATVVLAAAAADAKTVYVNNAIVTSGNGTSWATSFKYLRDALASTASGDQIWVAKGTYFPDDTTGPDQVALFGNREASFDIKGQEIYGGFVGTETNLSARNPVTNPTLLSGEIWPGPGEDIQSSLHVAVVSANSTLDSLTVLKGFANGSASWTRPRIPAFDQGGGCYVSEGKTLTLQTCTFTGNRAVEFGGAIMVENGASNLAGNVVATNCTFDQNTVTSYHLSTSTCAGGAIAAKVTATNCKFTANKVIANPIDLQSSSMADGGAIAGVVTATGCDFTGNTVNATGSSNGNVASGGAISGTVSGKNCTFTANISTAFISHAGAIRGAITAANCVFSANTSSTGTLPDSVTGTGLGGGGALYTGEGSSSLVNCIFVKNTSGVRGGAIVGAYVSATTNLTIMDSTFLDNGVATGFKGAAVSCMGIVRIANNIFWNTAATAGTLDQGDLINVTNLGYLRNSYKNYPVPVDQAQNVVKLGRPAISEFQGADVYLGSNTGTGTSSTLLSADPLFFNAADPDGADNIWRTADDGLRLKAGSSAIGTARDPSLTYRNFLVNDTLDIDGDDNVTELISADIVGFSRVQNVLVPLPSVLTPYLDMGAYEYGNILNAPEISIEYPLGTNLVDGAVAAVDFSALAGVATTFTIKNSGGSNLEKLSITGDGVDIASFKFSQPVTNVVASGGSTTFTVTFAPKLVGMRNAAIHIASTDGDENPFDINLKGSAPLPEIAVEAPVGTDLTDGTALIDYGSVLQNATLVKTFTIRNSGLGNLAISSIASAGTNAANFTVSAPGSTFLLPGATTTFDVTFSPSGTGNRSASIIIENSDPDTESSFLINLTGAGVGIPEIVAREPYGPELVTGVTNGFGSVSVGLLHSKTFVVKNTGNEPLRNIAVTLAGSGTFTKTNIGVTSLAPGAQAKFSVTFKPTATGKKAATLVIASNDADESQITVYLTGTGVSKASATASSNLVAASAALTGSRSGVAITVTRDSDGLKHLVLTVDKTLTRKRTVEVSSNLTEWFSGSKFTTVLLDNKSVLRVRDNTPVKPGEKRYIRLK